MTRVIVLTNLLQFGVIPVVYKVAQVQTLPSNPLCCVLPAVYNMAHVPNFLQSPTVWCLPAVYKVTRVLIFDEPSIQWYPYGCADLRVLFSILGLHAIRFPSMN
jgi:hypothetical protein